MLLSLQLLESLAALIWIICLPTNLSLATPANFKKPAAPTDPRRAYYALTPITLPSRARTASDIGPGKLSYHFDSQSGKLRAGVNQVKGKEYILNLDTLEEEYEKGVPAARSVIDRMRDGLRTSMNLADRVGFEKWLNGFTTTEANRTKLLSIGESYQLKMN